MNVVFLSPHFPPQFFHFVTALKARGVRVFGLGDAPWHELRPELQGALTEYVRLDDLHRYDDVLRAVAGLIHRHGRIDRVDSLNEHWLELEARLREDFNIVGQRPADTARNRSKSGMRDTFLAAGVPCTEGERLASTEHAWTLAAKYGYPLVFKPDVGVGAARTFKVRSEEELTRALQGPLAGYVAERFETGRLTSFDGLTDRSGRIVFCVSHKFSAGIMDIVNEQLGMHYYTRREMPPRLIEVGTRAVQAFGVKERFFHLELFETDAGEFRALEINVRPPGGFTTDLMNYACDVDVYALWADALTGADLSNFHYERRFHASHVARRDALRYRHDAASVRAHLGDMLVLSGRMPGALAGAMGDDFFMLRTPDEQALLEGMRFIEERE